MEFSADTANNSEEQQEIIPEQSKVAGKEQCTEAQTIVGDANPANEENLQVVVDWEAAVKEKDKLAADLADRLQRNMAEFDNYRKRTLKEKSYIYNDGVKDTIEKLLPVVDNFERALAAADDKENGLYKGLEMIFRQLSDIFKRMGVEPIAGTGSNFDYNVHHAIAHIEDETLGVNTVAEELQKGYKYKDKVLRPSMVKVAN